MVVGSFSAKIEKKFHAEIAKKNPAYKGEDIELLGYHIFDENCKSK